MRAIRRAATGRCVSRSKGVAMTSQPTDDSVPQGADRGTSPGGLSSPQLTRRGALRKRRPYRPRRDRGRLDRKSTRLNSSHTVISYAVFCLKKKKKKSKDTFILILRLNGETAVY